MKMFLKSAITTLVLSRGIKRWVSPTLKEIRRRKKKFGVVQSDRNQFLEWNYKAELYAFSKRLNENFNLDLLQKAFIHESYASMEEQKKKELEIFDENQKIESNKKLIKSGEELIDTYTYDFLKKSLPKLPHEGISAIKSYLTSDDLLSYIATNLGIPELILSNEPSQSKYKVSDTLKAIVGALAESSGNEKANIFIRDIICTQLNQKDLNDFWNITSPMDLLNNVCKNLKMDEPEPRLLGDAGKNTILSTYLVGIYSNKKLIGKGFGDSIDEAIDIAARCSLSELFGISNEKVNLNFKI